MKKFKSLAVLILALGILGCTKKEPTPEPIAEQKPVESVLNTTNEVEVSDEETVEVTQDSEVLLDMNNDEEALNEDDTNPETTEDIQEKNEEELEVNHSDDHTDSKPAIPEKPEEVSTPEILQKEEIIVPKTDPISINDIEIFTPTQEQLDSMQ